MFNHEPAGYVCPFCKIVAGKEDEYAGKNDIVYENEDVMVKVSPVWWVNNPGAVLVFPKKHYENIYDIPDDTMAELYKTVKRLATAIRITYGCQGTSTRQHNEPAGDQSVWHVHVHVFPRFENDKLYINYESNKFVDAAIRAPYAKKLRNFLNN